MRTVLANATVIDCVNPAPAGEAETIDLAGADLIPGLWDVHIHPDYFPTLNDMPIADQVTLFGHKTTQALLESGIVGLRCAGTHHYMDVAWKRAYDSGQHIGPRLALPYAMSGTGGSAVNAPSAPNTPSAASTCRCGLKLARSQKVCTNRTRPGRAQGAAAVYASVSGRSAMRHSSPSHAR